MGDGDMRLTSLVSQAVLSVILTQLCSSTWPAHGCVGVGVVRLLPATTTAQPAVWWAGGDRGKCGSQHTHSGWESRGFPDWASPL